MTAIPSGNVPPRGDREAPQIRQDPHGRPAPSLAGRPVHQVQQRATLPQTAPPAQPRRQFTWPQDKIAACRWLSKALWQVVVLSPTVALSAVPALHFWWPHLSWPALGLSVGAVLVATLVLCWCGIAWLERISSARPPASEVVAAEQRLMGAALGARPAPSSGSSAGPASNQAPRGEVSFVVAPAMGESAQALRDGRAADTSALRLVEDTRGLETSQRGMRGFMPCAAYARPTVGADAQNPWHRYSFLVPDGMSFNEIWLRDQGRISDAGIFTVLDGLAVVTGNREGRQGFGQWLSGLYAGFGQGNFLMGGGEVGATLRALPLGLRLNGNRSGRGGTRAQVLDNHGRGHRPLGGAGTDSRYALETQTDRGRGWALTPSLAVPLAVLGGLPLRGIWRRDGQTVHTDRRVLASLDPAAQPAQPPAPDATPLDWMAWLTRGNTLRAGDSFFWSQDAQRNQLVCGNVSLAYLGRHQAEQNVVSLRIDVRPDAAFALTFAETQQSGWRRMATLAGGLGADAGQRNFKDIRWDTQLLPTTENLAALGQLLAALRISQAGGPQSTAWHTFVAAIDAKVRRVESQGEVWTREAGVCGLPPCASYVKQASTWLGLADMPEGFGEGSIGLQRVQARVRTHTYAPSQALWAAQRTHVSDSYMLQPQGTVLGPEGTRQRHVTAALLREGQGPASLTLSLQSSWNMTLADAHEVKSFILQPLQNALGVRETPPGTPLAQVSGQAASLSSLLQTNGWLTAPTARWRTSRQVDLEARFAADALRALGNLQAEAWQGLEVPLPQDQVQAGVALSAALGEGFRLGADFAPETTAWHEVQAALGRFVDVTQLTAPTVLHRLLHRALAPPGDVKSALASADMGAPYLLRTQSRAYNRPQQYLDAYRRQATQVAPKERSGLVQRIRSEMEEVAAARVLAAHDPFLDPVDRQLHRRKLQHVHDALAALAAQVNA